MNNLVFEWPKNIIQIGTSSYLISNSIKWIVVFDYWTHYTSYAIDTSNSQLCKTTSYSWLLNILLKQFIKTFIRIILLKIFTQIKLLGKWNLSSFCTFVFSQISIDRFIICKLYICQILAGVQLLYYGVCKQKNEYNWTHEWIRRT